MKFIPHKTAVLALLMAVFGSTPQAQMAQDPLLSRTSSVQPNLVFMFDDSGSMSANYIYQYGGFAGSYGMSGPSPTTYAALSSDVNLMYYSPRTSYPLRVLVDGSTMPAGSIGGIGSFPVYFYKPGASSIYSVSSVTVGNGGSEYAASGVSATFSAAPVGGVAATGTVNISSTLKVASAAVTAGGSGYPSTGTLASFTPAPAGGTTATGSVTVAPRYSVNSVTVTTGGTGYPATGSTAVFTTAPSGGVTATGNVVVSPRYFAVAANVTSGGSGYASTGTGVTFSSPPSGVTATGNVTVAAIGSIGSVTVGAAGTFYPFSGTTGVFSAAPSGGTTATASVQVTAPVATAIITNPGSGYGSTVGASFSAPGGTGTTATATVTRRANLAPNARGIATIVITNAGSGYTSAPTITLTSPGGGTGATFSVTLAAGRVTGITVTGAGSGYTSAPTFTITGAPGAGATGTPVISSTDYKVTGISVTGQGSGYTSAPTITAISGTGSGAAATVVAGTTYTVTGVTITNAGQGYTAAPNVAIAGTGGSGAVGAVIANSTNVVTAINIINAGSGYTTAPVVTITGTGGSGATAVATTGPTNRISSITVTNPGANYTSPPTLTLSGTGGGTGVSFTVNTNATAVPVFNRKWDGTGSASALADYFTPSYLPDVGSVLATGANATLTYPNTASSTTATYPKFRDRLDCVAATHCTWAEEQQNYANWKTYHSTRLDLAKTGIGLAFKPLNPTFRLGWSRINTLNSANTLDQGVRLFDPAVHADFLTWLYARAADGGGTPNRNALDRVGQYYTRKDSAGPWGNNPTGSATVAQVGTDDATHASCRRSYALLMTDGYYNEGTYTLADQDSTSKTVTNQPNTFVYTGDTGPYSDTVSGTKFSNTFADVAMKYWATDLRPDIDNGLKVLPNDPAYWQHMNFYSIGLGLIGTLDATSPTVLQALTGTASSVPPRTLDWPSPSNNTPSAIDDMWHASINGRGKMLNARTAGELSNAITQLMSEVKGDPVSQSGVAVSSANLNSGTKKYTPTYTPVTWAGNVIAHFLDQNSGNETGLAWQVETASTDPVTNVITYSSLMPAAASRNIFVGNGATSGVRAVPFKYPDMSSAGLTSLMTGTVNANLIDYLRGDKANEDASPLVSTSIYRFRPTRLGDVVNSTPVFVKDTVDFNYQDLPSGTPGQSSYRNYVDGTGTTPAGGKKQRAEGLLVVGANDGMLHAFRDGVYTGTNATVVQGGIETFAYVPKALLPTLSQFSDKAFVHRYYVDGPLTETDAYFTAGSPRWANVVVGSTGGGAGAPPVAGVSSPRTAVFAIDFTSLGTSATAFNANNVLWEISSSDPSYSELGYTLSQVQTGTTLNGQWVAIFGNGYDSVSCQARLFIVNLETGAKIKEINTGNGSCGAGKNGLGAVHVVRNATKQIIGVYGGDLQGNMWKFNLNSSSVATWGVDLGGLPLFTGSSSKPITAEPQVLTLSATTTPQIGYMVVFGTGKFYEIADISSTSTQSVYGIWDPVAFGAAVIPTGTQLTSTSLLVTQTIGAATVGLDGNTFFPVSSNAVDYVGSVTPPLAPRRGWTLDLPNSGERLVFPVQALSGQFVIAETISPSNVSLDPCVNASSGIGFKYILNGLTGSAPDGPIFDTNGDGNVNSSDGLFAGYQTSADGRSVSLISSQNPLVTSFRIATSLTTTRRVDITCAMRGDCPPPTTGSGSHTKSRQWRQLFMR